MLFAKSGCFLYEINGNNVNKTFLIICKRSKLEKRDVISEITVYQN